MISEELVKMDIELAMSDYLMGNNTIVELLASPSNRISSYKKHKIQRWLNNGLPQLEEQIKKRDFGGGWKFIPVLSVEIPYIAHNGKPLMLSYCVVFVDSLHIIDIDVYGNAVQLEIIGDFSLLVLGSDCEFVVPLNSYRVMKTGILFETKTMIGENGEIIVRQPI